MAYAVMCCSCRKLMDWSGAATVFFGEGAWAIAADYATIDHADKAAVGHGWLSDNGNHRCRECRKAYQEKTREQKLVERQGAIVWLDKPGDVNGH